MSVNIGPASMLARKANLDPDENNSTKYNSPKGFDILDKIIEIER